MPRKRVAKRPTVTISIQVSHADKARMVHRAGEMRLALATFVRLAAVAALNTGNEG